MAARYARADAAKQFLQCGADPNIKDIKGRTPLHAAIASDSYGVFTIILNDRNGFFTDSKKLLDEFHFRWLNIKDVLLYRITFLDYAFFQPSKLKPINKPIKDDVISKQNQKTDQLV